MMLRDKLVRFHRYVGLAMAGYLVIAGLTGSVLELDRGNFYGEPRNWMVTLRGKF